MLENNTFASHVIYHAEVDHGSSSGLVACPVAGPDPQEISLVRLHARFEVLAVNWTSIREGAPPRCPSYKDILQSIGSIASNLAFLGGSRSAVAKPALGGHEWSASGVYNYVLLNAKGLDSNFPLGMTPWEKDNEMLTGDFYIPAANFETGVMNRVVPEVKPPPGPPGVL